MVESYFPTCRKIRILSRGKLSYAEYAADEKTTLGLRDYLLVQAALPGTQEEPILCPDT